MFDLDVEIMKDGESLTIGNRTLRVIELPWVHWPDTMFLHLQDEGILFASDAFGAFGALQKPVFDDQVDFQSYLKEAKLYFSTVVVGYRQMVLRDLEKVKTLGLDVRMIAPAHGVVLRKRIDAVVQAWTSWCKLEKTNKITVLYGSMYGLTKRLADFVCNVLKEKAKVVVSHNVAESRVDHILSDLVDCAGSVFLTPTYESSVFPPVSDLLNLMRIKRLGEGKHAAGIATRLWGGAASAQLAAKLKEAGYALSEPVGEYLNYPTEQELNTIKGFLEDFSEKALKSI
jgi:flavorubredoxin